MTVIIGVKALGEMFLDLSGLLVLAEGGAWYNGCGGEEKRTKIWAGTAVAADKSASRNDNELTQVDTFEVSG